MIFNAFQKLPRVIPMMLKTLRLRSMKKNNADPSHNLLQPLLHLMKYTFGGGAGVKKLDGSDGFGLRLTVCTPYLIIRWF